MVRANDIRYVTFNNKLQILQTRETYNSSYFFSKRIHLELGVAEHLKHSVDNYNSMIAAIDYDRDVSL